MTIRGLTLIQPHGSLIALGEKPFETRSWKMPAGIDLLAIHAGAKIDLHCLHGRHREAYLKALGLSRDADDTAIARALPQSGILCVCRVLPSILTTGEAPSPINHKRRKVENAGFRRPAVYGYQIFGSFSAGRYAWPVEPILICEPPIQYRGALGVWKLSPEIERVLLKAVEPTNCKL